METKRIAYSYMRFSSGKQADGDSTRRQREAFLEFCERRGYQPADDYEFFDRAASAYKKENLADTSQLMKLLKTVRPLAAKDAILVVEAWDRLTRANLFDAIALAKQIFDTGFAIGINSPDCVFEPLTTGSDTAKCRQLADAIIMAHEYSAALSRRLQKASKSKQNDAIEKKKPHGASVASWLQLVGDKKGGRHYDLREPQATAVEKMFRLAYEGLSDRSIAMKIRELGLGEYLTRQVKDIITSPIAYGLYLPYSKAKDRSKIRAEIRDGNENYYPKIVAKEMWLKVQAKRKARQHVSNGRPTTKGVRNLFSRRVFEITDGTVCYFNDKGGTIYLESIAARQGKSKNWKRFPYQDFEDAFLLAWLRYLPVERLTEESEANKAADLQSLRYQREHLQNFYNERRKGLSNPELYSDGLERALKEMEDKLKHFTDEIDKGEANKDNSQKKRAELLTQCVKQLLADQRNDTLRERVQTLIGENVERIDATFERWGFKDFFATLAIVLKGKQEIKIAIHSERKTITIWDDQKDDADSKPNLTDASGFIIWRNEKDRLEEDAKMRQQAAKRIGKKRAAKLTDGFQELILA